MQFRILLDNEDYIAFNIYHGFHSKAGKKAVLRGRFIGLFFSLIALSLFKLTGVSQRLFITELIVLGIYSIVNFFTFPARAKKRIRKQIEHLSTQGPLPYNHDSTLDFQDNFLWEYTPTSTKQINYAEILSAMRNNEYIYLMIGVSQAIIIPIRCLCGREEELINFLYSRGLQCVSE